MRIYRPTGAHAGARRSHWAGRTVRRPDGFGRRLEPPGTADPAQNGPRIMGRKQPGRLGAAPVGSPRRRYPRSAPNRDRLQPLRPAAS